MAGANEPGPETESTWHHGDLTVSSSSPHTLREALRRLEDDIGSMPEPPDNAAAVFAALDTSLRRMENYFQQVQEERTALTAMRANVNAERERATRDLAVARELYKRARALERAADMREQKQLAAAAVVPDIDGQDLRPDPAEALTPAELMAVLRQFRVWGGNPSFRAMAQRCGHRAAASTMCAVLGGDELPERLGVIEAIIVSSGGNEEDKKRFATAWRRLAMHPGSTAKTEPGMITSARPDPPGWPTVRPLVARTTGAPDDQLGGNDETGTVQLIRRTAPGPASRLP